MASWSFYRNLQITNLLLKNNKHWGSKFWRLLLFETIQYSKDEHASICSTELSNISLNFISNWNATLLTTKNKTSLTKSIYLIIDNRKCLCRIPKYISYHHIILSSGMHSMCNEKQTSFLWRYTYSSIKSTNISHVTCLYNFRCRCYWKALTFTSCWSCLLW